MSKWGEDRLKAVRDGGEDGDSIDDEHDDDEEEEEEEEEDVISQPPPPFGLHLSLGLFFAVFHHRCSLSPPLSAHHPIATTPTSPGISFSF